MTRSLFMLFICGVAMSMERAAYGAATLGPFPQDLYLTDLDGRNGFLIAAYQPCDYTGWDVSGMKDMTGDELNEIVIGAPGSTGCDEAGIASRGRAFVIYGQADLGRGGQFDLQNIDGSNGFRFMGDEFWGATGQDVSGMGDIDGDGTNDVAIAAPSVGPRRKVYVLFGQEGGMRDWDIVPLELDGHRGFTILGDPALTSSVSDVEMVGDVNDDGVDDMIITSAFAPVVGVPQTGLAYVLFGGRRPRDSPFVALTALDPSEGFIIPGTQMGGFLGYDSTGLGDINGDGIADFAVGERGADTAFGVNAGRVFVFFGRPGIGRTGIEDPLALDGTNGFIVNGPMPNYLLGELVQGVGDVNGDGFPDLLMGILGAPYLLFGGPDIGAAGVVNLSDLGPKDGVHLTSTGSPLWSWIWAASSACDINDDGYDDLIVGAPGGFFDWGRVNVIYGGPDFGSGGVIDVANLDGNNGFYIHGIDDGDLTGNSLDCAGDVNGDDVVDVVIGAPMAVPADNDPLDHKHSHGEAYVVFGRSRHNGDCDRDGDVDLVDFNSFQLCFTGAQAPGNGQQAIGEAQRHEGTEARREDQATGGISGDGAMKRRSDEEFKQGSRDPCACADLDRDGDVDLADFGQFQLVFTGAV